MARIERRVKGYIVNLYTIGHLGESVMLLSFRGACDARNLKRPVCVPNPRRQIPCVEDSVE